MAVINITKDNFQQEVVAASQTVLVDFWATWCGPCQMMGPILDELAAKHPEIKVGKINVDDCPDIAAAYTVHNIPTLVIFKNGQEAGRILGYCRGEDLKAEILKKIF